MRFFFLVLAAWTVGTAAAEDSEGCGPAIGEHRIEWGGLVRPWGALAGLVVWYRNIDSVIFPFPSHGVVVAVDAEAGTVQLEPDRGPDSTSSVGPTIDAADIVGVQEGEVDPVSVAVPWAEARVIPPGGT